MKSDFLVALTQLAAERKLPREIVLSAIEAALASAYRKDSVATGQDISVKLDPGSGQVTVNILKTVVESVEDEVTEISLVGATAINSNATIGSTIATESFPHNPGRIAAQTAKQVVMQRLREAERELVFEEYIDKVGEIFSVTVQRIESRQIIVDIGRSEAVMPIVEQMPTERYRQGKKIKVILTSAQRTTHGTELIVSRADNDLLRRLFEMEVPEIYNGAVEIVAISREAGSRSKVGVRARQDGIDPIGSCVGLRGVRIQNIVNELQGEKIDVLEWDKDVGRFIANSLNPAQVVRVELDSTTQAAIAVVPDRQLSLAIGKEGQNARLAAKLTGWNVDIKSTTEAGAQTIERARIQAEKASQTVPDPKAESQLNGDIKAPETDQLIETQEITSGDPPIDLVSSAGLDDAGTAPIDDSKPAHPIAIDPISTSVEIIDPDDNESTTSETPELVAELSVNDDLEKVQTSGQEIDLTALEISTAPDPEPVSARIEQPSLRDIPADVWSVPQIQSGDDPSVIRFAEDIQGLRGGVTARRARRNDSAPDAEVGRPRKRRSNARRRRR